MATTKGPILSLGARGSIGGAIIFAKSKRGTAVRKKTKPKLTRTPAQLSSRAMLKWLSAVWTTLTPSEKATWNPRAESLHLAPYNAFVKFNMARWALGNLPGIVDPVLEDDTPGILLSCSAYGAPRAIYITTFMPAANQNWSLRYHRSTSSGFTPSRDNVIGLARQVSSGNIYYTDAPLAPGTYYYRVGRESLHGVEGPTFAERSATAT